MRVCNCDRQKNKHPKLHLHPDVMQSIPHFVIEIIYTFTTTFKRLFFFQNERGSSTEAHLEIFPLI